MRDAPLSPVPCMDAPMPRARTCSPTRFARSSCLMTGAGAATQGYFLLLVQEKVAKENDTPDGATQPCAPRALGPALILRGILPRRSGADILSAPPSGRSPKGLRCSGLRHTGTQENHTLRSVLPLPLVFGEPLGARFKLTADS